MGRPHIEFIQALEVKPEPVREGMLAGARRRLLSNDDGTGASTALVLIAGGFSADLACERERVELFVLSGDARLAGQRLTPGCYGRIAPGAADARLEAGEPTHLLFMVDPALGEAGEPIEVIDSKRLRWAASSLAAVPAGLVNKRLHDDPQTGERTWLAACAPGWLEQRAEVHPTVEECFMLRGDMLLGTCGVMGPGCYFWRPPMVPHGPMYSRAGAEFFFRTKGGTLEVDYQTVPEWDRLVEDYRASEPLYPVSI